MTHSNESFQTKGGTNSRCNGQTSAYYLALLLLAIFALYPRLSTGFTTQDDTNISRRMAKSVAHAFAMRLQFRDCKRPVFWCYPYPRFSCSLLGRQPTLLLCSYHWRACGHMSGHRDVYALIRRKIRLISASKSRCPDNEDYLGNRILQCNMVLNACMKTL